MPFCTRATAARAAFAFSCSRGFIVWLMLTDVWNGLRRQTTGDWLADVSVYQSDEGNGGVSERCRAESRSGCRLTYRLDNSCSDDYNPGMKASVTLPKRRVRAKFDSLEQEVFLGLWRTYDRLKALEDELFATVDLTAQQYNVLRLLANVRPAALPTLELAGRLVSRAPDITRMLDKLERRGLIRRERPPEDRRVVHVVLSDDGAALVEKLQRPLRRLGGA